LVSLVVANPIHNLHRAVHISVDVTASNHEDSEAAEHMIGNQEIDEASLDAATPVAGSQKIKCYIMYGLGNEASSGGMDTLAAEIQKISPLISVAPVYDYYNWEDIVTDIKKQPSSTKIIVIGYSMGANRVTNIAAAIPKTPISLLVAYDPTVYSPVLPLGSNVKQAICFHSTTFNLLGNVGHALLTAGPGFNKKNLQTISTTDTHPYVDTDQKLHDHTLAAVKTVVKSISS